MVPWPPLPQLGSALINRDPRWHCERQYQLRLAGGQVDIFFLDTTPFIEKYLDRESKKVEWNKYEGEPWGESHVSSRSSTDSTNNI